MRGFPYSDWCQRDESLTGRPFLGTAVARGRQAAPGHARCGFVVTSWGGLGAVVLASKRARGVRSASGASRGVRRAELAAVPRRAKRGAVEAVAALG